MGERSRRAPGASTIGLVLALWLVPAAAPAATFLVDALEDANDRAPGDGLCETVRGDCSVRAALEEAAALPGADEILLGAGTHLVSCGLLPSDPVGSLHLTGEVRLVGAGAGLSLLDGQGCTRVLTVLGAGNVVEDLSVVGGEAGLGAGLWLDGTAELRGVELRGNGRWNDDGGPQGPGYGGGVLVQRGCLSLTDCLLEANYADHGAAMLVQPDGQVWMERTDFRQNNHTGPYSTAGGAILNRGSVSGRDCRFFENWAISPVWEDASAGGAIHDEGRLSLEDCEFEGNVGLLGGALHSSGEAELLRCTFRGNRAARVRFGTEAVGGAVAVTGGRTRLVDCLLEANEAESGFGSAAWVQGAGARLDLVGSLVTRQVSGPLHATDGARLALTNSTLTENGVDNQVTAARGAQASLSWSTVVGRNNLRADEGEIRLLGCLLADGTGGPCSLSGSAAIHTLGSNLFETAGCPLTGSPGTDLHGVSPLLGALADNGGATRTHALLPGSPARDLGPMGACSDVDGLALGWDQRAHLRPIDGDGDASAACDAGAFESAPASETGACSDGLDDDGDGATDCADPDCCGDPACAARSELDCCDGHDDDCDGAVDLADPDCDAGPGCPEEAGTGRCRNGLDDDRDGELDCADEGCLDEPACRAADPDGDGSPTACDCAPLDAAVQVVATELRVSKGPAGLPLLSWSDDGLPARIGGGRLLGLRIDWRASSTCLATGVPDGAWSDDAPSWTDQYYLIELGASCVRTGSGGNGSDSFGVPRPPCF